MSYPFPVLLNYLRRENKLFYHLCEVAMTENLTRLQVEFKSGSDVVDPSTKVSVLHIAATMSDSDILNYLIEKKEIAIDSKDCMGNTPLHFAALSGNKKAVKLLLEKGANKDRLNALEQMPWQVAATGELVHLLLDSETEQSVVTIPFLSLQEAIKEQNVEAVKDLLEIGIHPDMLEL